MPPPGISKRNTPPVHTHRILGDFPTLINIRKWCPTVCWFRRPTTTETDTHFLCRFDDRFGAREPPSSTSLPANARTSIVIVQVR